MGQLESRLNQRLSERRCILRTILDLAAVAGVFAIGLVLVIGTPLAVAVQIHDAVEMILPVLF